MRAHEPALPNICMWLVWLKQVPGPPSGIAPHPIILQTCAHRYEARQRVDQILETRDVIGRCFVLSQDLAIHDELDGGEWKFCEGRPQGHEQFGFCQQGAAAAFSPDSHYLLFGAPGTYNWKGESLFSWRGKGDQIVFLPQRGDFRQHVAKHAHIFTPYNPVALQHCPPMSCQHTHEWRYLLSFTWLCSSTPWHEPPHARLVLPINTAAHTSSLPFPSLHAAAG